FGIGRLAVVMSVKDDGSRGAGRLPFSIDRGGNVRRLRFQQSRLKSTPLHHFKDMRCVTTNVFAVRSNIGNRQQSDNLAQDLLFVFAPISLNPVLAALS